MSPIRRGSERKTRHAVEAFLEDTHPGADPMTKLHAIVCWRYYATLFGGRGTRESVTRKAEARGITHAKLRQIIAGNLTGIRWWALEAVLMSCGAEQADIDVALDLYDQAARQATPHTSPPFWPPLPEPLLPPAPLTGYRDHLQDQSPDPLPGDTLAADDPAAEPADEPATAPGKDRGDSLGGEEQDEGQGEKQEAPHHAPPGRQGDPVAAPDPQTATDPVEFVALMKAYRAYQNVTLREMAKRCETHPKVPHGYSYAAFSSIGKNGKLPARDLVCAYIAGAGGSNTDIDLWIQAHIRLSVEQATPPDP